MAFKFASEMCDEEKAEWHRVTDMRACNGRRAWFASVSRPERPGPGQTVTPRVPLHDCCERDVTCGRRQLCCARGGGGAVAGGKGPHNEMRR